MREARRGLDIPRADVMDILEPMTIKHSQWKEALIRGLCEEIRVRDAEIARHYSESAALREIGEAVSALHDNDNRKVTQVCAILSDLTCPENHVTALWDSLSQEWKDTLTADAANLMHTHAPTCGTGVGCLKPYCKGGEDCDGSCQ